MSSVRYMVTGSQPVSQELIDSLRNKGVQLVANWYGMTEFPPPVFIGYNSSAFDFTSNYDIEFENGECIINRHRTGDVFDVNSRTFLTRKDKVSNDTWKTNFNK